MRKEGLIHKTDGNVSKWQIEKRNQRKKYKEEKEI